jgi:Family of unknown function (DUF6356)
MVMIVLAIWSMMHQSRNRMMLSRLKSLFVAHPDALGESYLQHLGHAMGYAGRMFAAGLCALTHAIFPFLFEKTASNLIKQMYAEMTSRGATAAVEQAKVYRGE